MTSFRRQLKWIILCVLVVFGCQITLYFSFVDQSRLNVDEYFVKTSILAPRVDWRMRDLLVWQKFITHTPARTDDFYKFNKTKSDIISAWRVLPDTRDVTCSHRLYRLPQAKHATVSIIICFHNEARSTLLRTIISLISRTPASYLHEVILIDDCSEDVNLLFELDTVARQINMEHGHTVSLVRKRNERRMGLIESRNYGASLASGEYLLFLDSHCEVNIGWLEPLLERLALAKANGAAVAVSPLLDIIDAENLTYRASAAHLMGGFDWSLHFHWVQRSIEEKRIETAWPWPQRFYDFAEAFKSPAFSGGTFMLSKELFFKLNAFNTRLEIWGGESIEFSIKLWLCGGQIEIVPCSRIGHIFRKQHAFNFPHTKNNNNNSASDKNQVGIAVVNNAQVTYLRNSKIIAESWLDAYRYYYYASKPVARQIVVNVTQSDMDTFKRQQHCRPFIWYLQHVFPQLSYRLPMEEYRAAGQLRNVESCLHVELTKSGSRLYMTNCYRIDITHWYLLQRNGLLQTHQGSCLNVLPLRKAERGRVQQLLHNKYAISLEPCERTNEGKQRWYHVGPQLVHAMTQLCLDNPLKDLVAVSRCRYAAQSQLFQFAFEMQKQT